MSDLADRLEREQRDRKSTSTYLGSPHAAGEDCIAAEAALTEAIAALRYTEEQWLDAWGKWNKARQVIEHMRDALEEARLLYEPGGPIYGRVTAALAAAEEALK